MFYFKVGPCALDYSKTKTQDHFWTDPPADELVQRHRISSGVSTHLSCPRPVLNVSICLLITSPRRSLNTNYLDNYGQCKYNE